MNEKEEMVNLNKKISDSAGDRTQNLWFRRPAPYPLGHGVSDAIIFVAPLIIVLRRVTAAVMKYI